MTYNRKQALRHSTIVGRGPIARCVGIILVLLILSTVGVVRGANPGVPMFRGDAARTGSMPGPGPAGDPQLLWSLRTDGGGATSVTTVEEVVFVESDLGLQVLDAVTGAELWRVSDSGGLGTSGDGTTAYLNGSDSLSSVNVLTGAEYWRTPLDVISFYPPYVAGDLLFIFSVYRIQDGQRTDAPGLIAFDRKSGAEIWRHDYEPKTLLSYPPLIDGSQVTVASLGGVITSFDSATGTVLWKNQCGTGIPASPVIADGLVFAGANDESGTVCAFDTGTGADIWRFDTGKNILPSPVTSNGIVFIGNETGIWALDAATGSDIWHFERNGVSAPMLASSSSLFVLSGSSVLALDKASGAEQWSFESPDVYSDDPMLLENGLIYVKGRAYTPTVNGNLGEEVDGVVHAIDAATGEERWTSPAVPGGQVIASRRFQRVSFDLAVVNGAIQIIDMDLNIRSLDAATGAERWRFGTGGPVDSSPVVANQTVYVASNDDFLYAIDMTSGEPRWRFQTPDRAHSSPAVVDDLVYIGCMTHVYAVDAETGMQVWDFRPGGSNVWASPAVVDGVVYIPVAGGEVHALDALTGTEIWRFEAEGHFYSSPAVMDGSLFAGDDRGMFYALDAITGAERWRFSANGEIETTAAVTNGLVHFADITGGVYALDIVTGAVQWQVDTASPIHSSPAVVDGVVYLGNDAGTLIALDADTGAQLWQLSLGAAITSSPGVTSGTVYVGSGDGNLYAIDAATGTELWRFGTGGPISSSPAVVGGVVYVGSDDGRVYAIGGTGP